MNPTRPGVGLPPGLRRASIFCLILSALVGVTAASQAMSLTRLAELHDPPTTSLLGTDPEVYRRQWHAEVQALEEMKGPRAVILTLLSLCAGLTFAGAARVLRPGVASRELSRRLLAGTAVACAVFRTLDGAQAAVIMRRMATAGADALVKSHDLPDPAMGPILQHFLPTLMSLFSIALTVLMTGGFLLLSRYFRSKEVREFAAREDSA